MITLKLNLLSSIKYLLLGYLAISIQLILIIYFINLILVKDA